MRKLMTRLRPNQCPICMGTLSLTEIEKNTFPLNENGARDNFFEQDYYDIYLTCDECGHRFEADKKGEFFFIKRDLPEVKLEENNKMISFNPFLAPGGNDGFKYLYPR